MKEVSKRDGIIMGDFNHGHMQLTYLQSTGREDQEFLNLIQDNFIYQKSRSRGVEPGFVGYSFSLLILVAWDMVNQNQEGAR